ncbi:UDP-N-acetyl glucosamine 2-epimerase [Actinokineospora iranica]|uniref:UDP-N-acetyl glucosamine 2-epimerase n=1 Tax=Actinokineospora iranica TaxID=1271860 RepID=UPI001113A61D|nr:UDP-N-acetyl glucosamine 2-epimerase [Actinokineospora iranica]
MPTDSARWDTFRWKRTVLAVARTMTSAIRLLEALSVFAGDPRVRVVFTVDPGSEFSLGVAEHLRSLPARVEPWKTARTMDCDLVITASEKVNVPHAGYVPLIVVPHGIGFHKIVPDADGPEDRLSGLVTPEVLRRGRVSLLVTHPDQESQLAAVSQATVGLTVLGGDTSYDGLLASLPHRDRYRRALGVADHQRLVLASSTWRGQSLVSGQEHLLERLLGELPADDYRVAAVVHPNVWTQHGAAEVRRILDPALRAGLLLIDPTAGWHGTLVAADAVIGDHGSVSLYAAAIGKPLVLGAFGAGEVVPGTPLAELGRTAPALDHGEPLRPQLDKLIATHLPPSGLAERLFARPGEAACLLRRLCYQRIGLPEPAHEPPTLAMPEPRPDVTPVSSYQVAGRLTAPRTVTLDRFPAAVRAYRAAPHPDESRHLAVGLGERNVRLFNDAAVIVASHGPVDLPWLAETLARYPFSRLTAGPTLTGCAVALRGGGKLLADGAEADPAAVGSALYTLLVAGEDPEGPLTVRMGATESVVTVRRG